MIANKNNQIELFTYTHPKGGGIKIENERYLISAQLTIIKIFLYLNEGIDMKINSTIIGNQL